MRDRLLPGAVVRFPFDFGDGMGPKRFVIVGRRGNALYRGAGDIGNGTQSSPRSVITASRTPRTTAPTDFSNFSAESASEKYRIRVLWMPFRCRTVNPTESVPSRTDGGYCSPSQISTTSGTSGGGDVSLEIRRNSSFSTPGPTVPIVIGFPLAFASSAETPACTATLPTIVPNFFQKPMEPSYTFVPERFILAQ